MINLGPPVCVCCGEMTFQRVHCLFSITTDNDTTCCGLQLSFQYMYVGYYTFQEN